MSLTGNRIVRRPCIQILVVTTCLDDREGNRRLDAVEDRTVVETLIDVTQEVGDTDRRSILLQRHHDIAHHRSQPNSRRMRWQRSRCNHRAALRQRVV